MLLSTVLGALGLLVGSAVGRMEVGPLAGLAVGLLSARAIRDRGKIRDLASSLAGLQARVRELERSAARPTGAAAPTPEAWAPAPPAPDAPAGEAAPPSTTVERPPAARPAPEREAVRPPSAPPEREAVRPASAPPSLLKRGGAWLRGLLFGGNTVVRVGILVLLVGVALLAKWAADHALFPIEARLGFAALIGLALTTLGYCLRNRRPGFGTTLQGGGLAALYLTTFAAFRIFDLLPVGLAFVLFVAIAAASAVFAVVQRDQALIVIGSLGGFLAPILASTGAGNHVVLFGYYLVLNVAVACVAFYRSWRVVHVLAFVCTYGVATAWGALRYQPEHFATTEPFVIAFFLLFTGEALIYAWRRPPNLRGIVDGTLVFGTPAVTLLAQAALVRDMELGLAYSSVGFGLFYAGAATWIWRTAPQTLGQLCEAFVALAIGFGTMAIPLAFEDSPTTAIAWSLEGAGIYWVGTRQGRRLARVAGLILQPMAAIALVIFLAGPEPSGAIAVLNGRFLSCLALAGAALFIGREAQLHRSSLGEIEWRTAQGLAIWGLGWWAFGSVGELEEQLPASNVVPAAVALIGLSAVALEAGARRSGWSTGRPMALLGLPAAFASIPPALERPDHLLAHGGLAAWTIAIAGLYWVLDRLLDGAERWSRRATPAMIWLVASVAGLGLAGVFGVALDLEGDWPLAGLGIGIGASAAVAVAFLGRGPGPLGRFVVPQLTWGVGPVLVAALGWIWGSCLSARGDVAPLPYLPLLNPVDLGAAVIGVDVALFAARGADRSPTLARWSRAPVVIGLLAATAFAWLNAVLVRSVVQWTGVEFEPDALWDSVALHVALSITWTLVALCGMWVSTRWSLRGAWLAFAGLLGATVVKLFVVDLSQLSTPAKICTFLVVGALLLVVGYLSPVPPGGPQPPEQDAEPGADPREALPTTGPREGV